MSSYLDMHELATSIKKKRGNKGLREAVQEIGGVSASTLSRIENGKAPDMETFLLVCDWLEIAPAHFLKNTNLDEEAPENDTPHAIEIQLRADKNLDAAAASALAAVVKAAYQEWVRQSPKEAEPGSGK